MIPSLTLALVLMPVLAAAQVTHTVNQVGTSFSPSQLTIEVGDTVRWVWSVGFHTVTSGTGASDPGVGALFDTPLNSTAPQFEFQFTEAGTVDYFCRPHEIVDMKGTIVVEDVSTSSPPAAAAALLVHGVSPNPFNPRTSVSFTLAQPSPVSIAIHDIRGRLVRDLATATEMESGGREIIWNGLNNQGVAAPSGVYFFRVRALGLQQVVRGVLVR
jgi:plastocyanin